MPGCGEWCEFNASETTCFCLRTQSLSICQILSGKRGTDEQRQAYRALVHAQTLETSWSEPVIPGLPHYTAPQKPRAVTEAVIVTETVPLAISIAVTQCPHRTQKPNCGCAGKWRCSRDDKDVTFPECVQCQTNQGASHDSV